MEKNLDENEDQNLSDQPNQDDDFEKQENSSDLEDQSHDEEQKGKRLEAKLNEAYGKQDDLQNKYLRVHADLENLKKRAIKEREDAVQRTRSQLISDLLPIIDAFQMGLTEATKHEGASEIVEGFAMAMKQMHSTLDSYGLIVLEPEKDEFDPKFHEAINYEVNNDLEEGTVVKTIRSGYRLGDKLLRPASVILSKSETDK
ncbi:MAG: nucleotide exchange factor GrpE [Opitutae bacterium]|jgi:molecular chaperone GrpE|nr:nucleotide exchange factor GrpE [Opitutae bacterium]